MCTRIWRPIPYGHRGRYVHQDLTTHTIRTSWLLVCCQAVIRTRAMSNSIGEKRVLSIQSHVVHGYVGNRAATFPLQVGTASITEPWQCMKLWSSLPWSLALYVEGAGIWRRCHQLSTVLKPHRWTMTPHHSSCRSIIENGRDIHINNII